MKVRKMPFWTLSPKVIKCPKVRSGKTDPVQFKWRSKQGPLCLQKMVFCMQLFSSKAYDFYKRKLPQADLSFKSPSSKPLLSRTGSVFALPPKIFQEWRSSINIKFLGGILLGHQGPRHRDIPDKKFMQVAFFCCFRQGVAGMSGFGSGRPGFGKLMQENFGLIFRSLLNASNWQLNVLSGHVLGAM